MNSSAHAKATKAKQGDCVTSVRASSLSVQSILGTACPVLSQRIVAVYPCSVDREALFRSTYLPIYKEVNVLGGSGRERQATTVWPSEGLPRPKSNSIKPELAPTWLSGLLALQPTAHRHQRGPCVH